MIEQGRISVQHSSRFYINSSCPHHQGTLAINKRPISFHELLTSGAGTGHTLSPGGPGDPQQAQDCGVHGLT
jgi:hypothetical protein